MSFVDEIQSAEAQLRCAFPLLSAGERRECVAGLCRAAPRLLEAFRATQAAASGSLESKAAAVVVVFDSLLPEAQRELFESLIDKPLAGLFAEALSARRPEPVNGHAALVYAAVLSTGGDGHGRRIEAMDMELP